MFYKSIIFSATDNGTDNFSCFYGLVLWCDLLKITQNRQNTDWQVVSRGLKLILHWEVKQTPKFSRKYAHVTKKKHFKADYPLFHWLIIGLWKSFNLR